MKLLLSKWKPQLQNCEYIDLIYYVFVCQIGKTNNFVFRYCVRPNAALIEPGKSLDVSIILLGLKEEPAPDFKCNDKFLIVALPAPYDLGESTVADVWPKLEAEFKPQSVSKKIKVKYVFEKATSGEPKSTSQASTGIAGGVVGNTTSGSESAPISDVKIEQDDSDLTRNQSKIDALNEKLDSNVAQSSKDSKPLTATKPAQSIGNAPLTTVILIALIAFIIGWLFF